MENSSLSYEPFFAISGDSLEKQLQKSIFWFFIILLLIIFGLNYKKLFMNNIIEQEDYYQSKGYVSKVNELLAKFVKEDYSELRVKDSMQVSLNNGRLRFFVGEDVQSIKLIGIENFTKESSEIGLKDSLFYFASNLEKHLKLQKENPLRNIFKVEFKYISDSTFQIKSITIDDHIINTSIPSNPETWLGNVFVNQPKQLDSVLFLKVGVNWIPLPIQRMDSSSSYKDTINYEIDQLYKMDLHRTILDNFFLKETIAHKVVIKHNSQNRLNFRIEKRNNRNIVLTFNSILEDGPSIIISTPSGKKEYNQDNTDQSIVLENTDFPCSISYTQNNKKFNYIITTDSPYKKLSFVVNSTKGKQRHISKIGDFYTRQIINQVIANQNKNIKRIDKFSNITLSPNAVLAERIEAQLKFFSTNGALNTQVKDNMTVRLGITVLNTSNGEVLAAPFYENTESYKNAINELKNFNLINHPIGSTFKPLLTSTILELHPDFHEYILNKMNISTETCTNSEGEEKECVIGISINGTLYSFERGFAIGKGFENSLILSMKDFIRKSNDAYPVALLIKAVERDRILNPNAPRGVTISNRFMEDEDCKFKRLFKNNYAIKVGVVDSTFIDYRCWLKKPEISDLNNKKNRDSLQLFNILSPETVNLRGDLIGSRGKESFRNEMIPWILGSGNNWWSNMKMAESYCRFISNREVFANFNFLGNKMKEIAENRNAKHSKGLFINEMSSKKELGYSTWGNVIGKTLINSKDTLVIIAKTGTPNRLTVSEKRSTKSFLADRFTHHGIFAFTVMSKKQFEKLMRFYRDGQPLPNTLGITCYLSIQATHNENLAVTKSENAVNFISESVLKDLVSQNKHLF